MYFPSKYESLAIALSVVISPGVIIPRSWISDETSFLSRAPLLACDTAIIITPLLIASRTIFETPFNREGKLTEPYVYNITPKIIM